MSDRFVATRILFPCTLAIGLWAGSAQAAPVHLELGVVTTTAAEPLVQKVHGFHRSCRYSAATGRWHRHLHSGRPVGCGSYYYYDYDYYDFPGFYFYFGDGHRRYYHYRGHRPHYRGHYPGRHR